MIKVSTHDTFGGYVNVTEVIKEILGGSHNPEIEFDSDSLDLVASISADRFDYSECGAVLTQVVQEWLNALEEYGTDNAIIGSLRDFDSDLQKVLDFYYEDEDRSDLSDYNSGLIGTIAGFNGSDQVYIELNG